MSEGKHSLVVVAERIWDAQFRNIHQSKLSIPGVAIIWKKILQKSLKQTARGDQFWSLHISSQKMISQHFLCGISFPPSSDQHTQTNKK